MGAQTIESISEFLLHAGTNFQILDMGRELTTMDAQTFLNIENGISPVPRPRQQHAWFGILFWRAGQNQNEYIWFLKLPVDEQGLLVTASRNHFLQIIVDALGNSLTDESDESQTLPDNPYNFVPNQQQMGLFNAFARHLLGKAQTQGTGDVSQYLRHPAVMDWTQLPVQAITDLALHINEPDYIRAITECFDLYAEDFQVALLSGCETVNLDTSLLQLFCERLSKASRLQKKELAILRALTQQSENDEIKSVLESLMTRDEPLDVDSLSVIAARHYMQLDTTLLGLFFEQAASRDKEQGFEGALFKGLFTDLVQVPLLRENVLALLRSTQRSETLAWAIGQLFTQARG